MSIIEKILGRDPKRSAVKEDFWGVFKTKYPREAHDIEVITGERFSLLSNLDAMEKVKSLQRLADNNHCRIGEVKDAVLNSFKEQFGESRDAIELFIHVLEDQKLSEEALRFNISKSNTLTHYLIKWFKEYALTFPEDEIDDSFDPSDVLPF